jgi:YD repeat-containing protein
VLEERYDNADPVGTSSQIIKRYDLKGRPHFQSYPQRGVTDVDSVTQGLRTSYDALDRVLRLEQDSELGVLATTTEYLPGLQMRTTNPRGHQSTTGYMAWDSPGYELPLWNVLPEGKVIEITRHPHFGWPLQLKQRNAEGTLHATRRYVHDDEGSLCKTIEPETGSTVLEYDAAGNVTGAATGLALPDPLTCDRTHASVADRRVGRSYDARNRLKVLDFPDGRGNQVWTWTADGLPASITTWNSPGGTQPVVNAYHYNQRRLMDGQGDSVSQPGWYAWGLGYGYDRNGALATQRYPTGLIVDYAPNALGQATLARNAHQPTVVYASGVQYHPNGAVKQFTYGNGLAHTMTQNARQLPMRVTATGNALDNSYEYDRNANPVQILDHVTGTPTLRHRSMTYDALDRLTTAESAAFGGSDGTHRFTYDALDNLTSWKHAGVKDYAEYLYDAQNRLTSIRNSSGATVVGLAYDLQGNFSNKNGQLYQFDQGNRLRGTSSGELYLYDGLGRRVQTIKASGDTTLWQYSHGGQLLFSWDGPGNQKTHEYVYLAGSLVATIDHHWPSNVIISTKYHHTDALGSPVAVSDHTGVVIERNDYEPWGRGGRETRLQRHRLHRPRHGRRHRADVHAAAVLRSIDRKVPECGSGGGATGGGQLQSVLVCEQQPVSVHGPGWAAVP